MKDDRERTGNEFRRLPNVEIDGAHVTRLAGLPDEVAAENIGMKRADENADAPERHARGDHPLAQLRHHLLATGDDRAPSISQSVIFLTSSSTGPSLRCGSSVRSLAKHRGKR